MLARDFFILSLKKAGLDYSLGDILLWWRGPGNQRTFEAGSNEGTILIQPGLVAAVVETDDRVYAASITRKMIDRAARADFGSKDHIREVTKGLTREQSLMVMHTQRLEDDGERKVQNMSVWTTKWDSEAPTDEQAVMLTLCLS